MYKVGEDYGIKLCRYRQASGRMKNSWYVVKRYGENWRMICKAHKSKGSALKRAERLQAERDFYWKDPD